MQQTRFCGKISLIMLSHPKIIYFLWNSPVMRRDLARLTFRKKNLSEPSGQNVSFNAVNSAFIYLFVGWDALVKARRGKEKNRSKKRTLTGKHLGS